MMEENFTHCCVELALTQSVYLLEWFMLMIASLTWSKDIQRRHLRL